MSERFDGNTINVNAMRVADQAKKDSTTQQELIDIADQAKIDEEYEKEDVYRRAARMLGP